jgi:hypothetical protein
LLGIINGKGMAQVVVPLSGAPGSEQSLWGTKRACEDDALGWGFGHQEFYTIWEFAQDAKRWAKFVDVDGKAETQSHFHGQTLFESALAADPTSRGADVALYDAERYLATLAPAIRLLAPYTDFYNFKCEQHGPWGQGFGDDGERWVAFGVTGQTWARNFHEANKPVHELIESLNPRGRVQAMDHWMPSIRRVQYDTALARGQPMAETTDVLTTHFSTLVPFDLNEQGREVPGETFAKQYPGGRWVPFRGSWPGHYVERGFRPLDDTGFVETAIDFNRYRLGRTEKDIKPPRKPEEHRWGNGQPFDYRAGFRGDEPMYNSEHGIYVGQGAATPYQFLHGFFSYSLLPTAAAEPRDLRITKRLSLTQTIDLPVNLYGRWIDGAGHTKRLRTEDPLYGDLFGWTGAEYCNMGDYIRMVGIKDAHHRLPGADAYGLVRRTCYAFVTSGPVVPAALNEDDTAKLFVKCVLQTFDHRRYIGLYAANFDERPHELDVTLPIAFGEGAEMLVFDDRAADWKHGKRAVIPAGKEFRYRAMLPALSAWLVLIPSPDAALADALGLPAATEAVSPASDEAIAEDQPRFEWKAPAGLRFVVEVAREALFREEDRIELSQPTEANSYTMKATPPARGRYFWRVRAEDDGGPGFWSQPRAFVYQWPEYAAAFAPELALLKPAAPVETPAWQKLADEHGLERARNLAAEGEIYGTGGRMRSPSRAVDGQAFSWWTNGIDEGNSQFTLPAEWCIIWRGGDRQKPVTIKRISILWHESALPKKYVIQAGPDGQRWTELHQSEIEPEPFTRIELESPVEASYFRLLVTESSNPTGEVGVREVVIE